MPESKTSPKDPGKSGKRRNLPPHVRKPDEGFETRDMKRPMRGMKHGARRVANQSR